MMTPCCTVSGLLSLFHFHDDTMLYCLWPVTKSKVWSQQQLKNKVSCMAASAVIFQGSCRNLVDLNLIKAICKRLRHMMKLDRGEECQCFGYPTKASSSLTWSCSRLKECFSNDPKNGLCLATISNQPADRNFRKSNLYSPYAKRSGSQVKLPKPILTRTHDAFHVAQSALLFLCHRTFSFLTLSLSFACLLFYRPPSSSCPFHLLLTGISCIHLQAVRVLGKGGLWGFE
ncbi:unnamed protein product [Citrullus colocynthis]|uniref:Uncharacterized protein n=1 Tax=Citrullus colocynthis TaxID=252529 RepID=A0ABP0XZF3_9ROSI